MRYKSSKKDTSQAPIEAFLKQLQISYVSLHFVGEGFPDMIVGVFGINVLIEIKSHEKSKLRPNQEKFHAEWGGSVFRADSVEDVADILLVHEDRIRNQNDQQLIGRIRDWRAQCQSSS